MTHSNGLAGIEAGETAISAIGASHNTLHYRGYEVSELIERRHFDEVAYLLSKGSLPSVKALSEYQEALLTHCHLAPHEQGLIELMPRDIHFMDALRTLVSFTGHFHADESVESIQLHLISKVPVWLMALSCHAQVQSVSKAQIWFEGVAEKVTLGHHTYGVAAQLLNHALNGLIALKLVKPVEPQVPGLDEVIIKGLDTSLILYAEHEFNASTFACRVTASTLSDPFSALTTAIGTLKGHLHGGANEAAMALILEASRENDVKALILDKLANKEKIMGFGHRVYDKGDPRHPIIKACAESVIQNETHQQLYQTANEIEVIMLEEKGIHPNLDFFAALAYQFSAVPVDWFTPIFVMSRMTGWLAHYQEQVNNNRLIRPSARYTGPAEKEVPHERN